VHDVYLFLASDTFSVNLIHSGMFSIHYVFYILRIIQLLYHFIIHFDTLVQASECLSR